MKYIYAFLKHAFLFSFSNLIAITIITLYLNTLESLYTTDINIFINIGILFLSFAMIFTIIPYIIIIALIKATKDAPILEYIIGGTITPIFLYLLIGHLTLIAILIVIGALCGAIYGFLDKRIPIPIDNNLNQ